MTWHIILLLLIDPPTASSLACSDSATLSLKAGPTLVDMETGERIRSTKLMIGNINNGVTACFDLETPEGDTHRYAISVASVEGSVAFEDEYEFGLPNVTATCTCSCTDSHDVLETCKDDDTGFCDGYVDGHDRCVEVNQQPDDSSGCLSKLTSNPTLCCTIGMKQAEITERFKAFQVQTATQYDLTVVIYPNYLDNTESHTFSPLLGGKVMIGTTDLIFEYVQTYKVGEPDNAMEAAQWYLGKSEPYSPDVYETSKEMNGKSEYGVHKVGWARYIDGSYQLNADRVTNTDIGHAFEPTINDCGKSEITSTFDSPKLADFKASLTSLSAKHSSIFESITWQSDGTVNHGKVEWVYKKSALITTDLELKMPGDEALYRLEMVTTRAIIGVITAQVVVTEHGARYIQINTTGASGAIYGTYMLQGDEDSKFSFTFEITEEKEICYIAHNSLECRRNAIGQLCLTTNKIVDDYCLENVKCSETKIKESDVSGNDIQTDTVVAEDWSNLSTWAKFANPLEWFKDGISSWQEAIVLGVELIGVLGGVFLVLKILRIFGVLGKCCRCMWCCFLCPKTEKKMKKQASCYYSNTKRRFTENYYHTRNRLATSINLKRSTLRRSQKERADELMRSETFVSRARTNTVQIMAYIRRKLNAGEADSVDLIPADKERGSSTGTIDRDSTEETGTTRENRDHTKDHTKEDSSEKNLKKQVSKTVSFKEQNKNSVRMDK